MIDFQISVDPRVVNAAFERLGARVGPALDAVTLDYGYRALAMVRRNASGRPGPNAPTGDYRRSWTIDVQADGSVVIGTNAAQGRRLENGFTGEDSLGRFYNQKAFPHAGPAYRSIGPQYRRAITETIRRLAAA